MKTDLAKLKNRNLLEIDFFKKWNSVKLFDTIEKLGLSVDEIPTYILIKTLSNYIKSENNGKQPSSLNTEYYTLRGHSIEYAKKVISDLQKNNSDKLIKKRLINPERYKSNGGPICLKYWKAKGFSTEDSAIKQLENSPNSIYYYIKKGFSKEESILKVSEFQRKQALKFSKKRKENPEKYIATLPTQLNYWIKKGFSIEEAKQKLKERQSTFTLEKCIEKLGIIEGTKKYNNRQEKWIKSLHKNFNEQGDSRSPSSKFANEIIALICKELNIEIPKKEKWISSKDGKLKCSYDFTYNNKIIEFNGDYWHANPLMHKSTDVIRGLKITAKEKWDMDNLKIELAKINGYDVLTIWEIDYNENKENTLQKCLNYLKN
jgi:hypothetical protein